MAAFAVLFVVSVASLVQSFLVIKISALALLLGAFLVQLCWRGKMEIFPRLLYFYLVLFAAGVIWVLVGYLNPATYSTGVFDALRLYCLWSAAFFLLYNILRSMPFLNSLHLALVLAGMTISAINFFGLADQFFGWGLVSLDLRFELDQFIAIYDGYIQITSQNIGPLFLIVPYLIAVQSRADAKRSGAGLTWVSLALSVGLAVASGRRALLLLLALTPVIVLAMAVLTGSLDRLKDWARRLFIGYTVALLVGAAVVVVLPDVIPEVEYVDRLQQAFSAEDERTIQKPYLIEAFQAAPLIGSGFGAAASYLRSEDRPWAGYELTYYQMLFNIGLAGMTLMVLLFATYLAYAFRNLRKFADESAIPFALLTGIVCLLIGAYSNRYLGSFDLLFFVGILPYLATFTRGFVQTAEPHTQLRTAHHENS
jgi:hypothetical protein